MISKQKVALIHVGKKELGWSDEVYRHVLRDHGGVESAKDLDEAGAKKVIDHMKAMGFWIVRKFEQQRPRDASEMITKPQQEVIDHLWADLTEFIPQAHMHRFRQGFHNRVQRAMEAQFFNQTYVQAETLTASMDSLDSLVRSFRLLSTS